MRSELLVPNITCRFEHTVPNTKCRSKRVVQNAFACWFTASSLIDAAFSERVCLFGTRFCTVRLDMGSIIALIVLNGLSISAISPTLIGWIKQFLNLTPIELTVVLISNSLGGILFSLLIGFIFKYIQSKHLIYSFNYCCFIMFTFLFDDHLHSKNSFQIIF